MGVFRITGIETTQAIQTFGSPRLQSTTMAASDNSVPMVANRRTIVRVYVGDARPGSRLVAYIPYGSPTPFGAQPMLYSNQIVTPPMPPDRRRTDHTLQIVLPPQPPGSRTFSVHVVEIDPTFVIPPREVSPTLLTLNFVERRLVRLRLVRIDFRGRGLHIPPRSVQDFWNVLDIPHRLLPVRMPGFEIVRESVRIYDGDFTQISPEAHNTKWAGHAGNQGTTGSLLNILDSLAATEGLPADVIYVGFYPPGANNSPHTGWAVSRWIISDADGMTLAHELAHKLCVPRHAPCGGPAYVDGQFPKFANLPDASIGDVGFDPSGTSTTYDPALVKDLMSYCSPKWISAYTYQRVFQCLAPPAPPAPQPVPFVPHRTIPLVLVQFPPNRWIKVELPHLPQTPPRSEFWPPIADGPVQAIVFHKDGHEFGRVNAPLQSSSTRVEPDGARIELQIPWSSDADRIEVRIGERVIWKHTEREETPTIDVRWPTARLLRKGTGRISWAVSEHTDYIVVRASCDGGASWAAKVLPGSAKALLLDRTLIGSGVDCRLEVTALRGFRSARVERKPFRVEPDNNAVLILSPSDGQLVEEGATCRLEGISSNPRAAIDWYSDIDGHLGSDAFLLVSSLSLGEHVIEAHSSVPFEASTRIHIEVKRGHAKR